jgi:hypothetical protein
VEEWERWYAYIAAQSITYYLYA